MFTSYFAKKKQPIWIVRVVQWFARYIYILQYLKTSTIERCIWKTIRWRFRLAKTAAARFVWSCSQYSSALSSFRNKLTVYGENLFSVYFNIDYNGRGRECVCVCERERGIKLLEVFFLCFFYRSENRFLAHKKLVGIGVASYTFRTRPSISTIFRLFINRLASGRRFIFSTTIIPGQLCEHSPSHASRDKYADRPRVHGNLYIAYYYIIILYYILYVWNSKHSRRVLCRRAHVVLKCDLCNIRKFTIDDNVILYAHKSCEYLISTYAIEYMWHTFIAHIQYHKVHNIYCIHIIIIDVGTR